MTGDETYITLRQKEIASGQRKYYPLKEVLLVPNMTLPQGIGILKELYILLRKLDDICDGDTFGYDKDIFIEGEKIGIIVEYIISGKGNINLRNPLIKKLFEILTQIFNTYGIEILESILESVRLCYDSLLFDKSRINSFSKGNPIFQNEDEIKKRLLDLELYGVLRPLLVLLGNKGFDLKAFEEMIILTRGDYYFSRDIIEDTSVGLFNYDVGKFNTQEDARDFMLQRGKIEIGRVISDIKGKLRDLNISWRIAIEYMYLRPAQRYFEVKK